MTDHPDHDADRDEDMALAAEYALGLLTPAEARAFEDRLAVDPEFRTLYALWAEDLASLTDDIAPVTPPAAVQAALQSRLFPVERQSWLQRLGLIPAMLGGLVAALLVLWAVNFDVLLPDPATGPAYAARITAEDQSLVVQASFDPAAAQITLDRTAGAAPPGRVLELWLIAGENPPVSLGLLPETPTGVLTVSAELVAALPGGTLAISEEPPGGSTTGLPTGAVLALGPVTEI